MSKKSGEHIKFQNEQEVMEHYLRDKEHNQVVIFDGIVYDVKEYAPDHPGGEHYLLERLGKNIEEDFEEAEHTKSARNVLRDLPVIGSIQGDNQSTSSQESNKKESEEKFGVSALYGLKFDEKLNTRIKFDYNRGLLYQIWTSNFTFEEYCTYINEPKHLVNPIRDIIMFDHWFLEMFSRAAWYVVPIGMLPWEMHCIYHMMELNFSYNPAAIIAMLIAGVCWWTFLEYTLHRFVFHGEEYWMRHVPHTKYLYTIHFLLHGIHHSFPQDRFRLVFPTVPAYVTCYLMIYLPLRPFVSDQYFYNLIFGVLIGYQAYDLMHYFMHHSNPKEGSYLKMMKTYHMQHHYKFGSIGFGVSSKFWDLVFNSGISDDQSVSKGKVKDN